MPQNETPLATVNGIIKQHRHSLQPKPSEIPSDNFRHTQSHRYDSEGKKKTKKATVITPVQPTINEGSENEIEQTIPEKKSDKSDKKSEYNVFTIENEKRISRSSRRSEKSNYAYDNVAYDINMDKRSISSRAGSSRQPSVQSLEVVREQYCCCAKRTKCEKKLLLTVTVLSIVIVVLVIVLAIVASNRNIGEDFKKSIVNSFK